MHKMIFVVLMTCIICQANAQVKIINVAGREGSHSEGDSFPVVSAANAVVAKKINLFLQTILGNDSVETNPAKLFNNATFKNENSSIITGLTMISYTVILNNQQVLTLRFDMEHTGAYLAYDTKYYSFNTATGEIIKASDLLTTAGLAWLKKYLIKERAKRIQKHIRENYPDFEDSVFMRETFAECNQEINADLLAIQQQSILFYKEDCFPHAWLPLETDLNIPIRIKGNEKYFTASGKRLLSIR